MHGDAVAQPLVSVRVTPQRFRGQRRHNKARHNTIDLDVILGPLDRHHPADLGQASLGRTIDRNGAQPIAFVGRADIDDLAATLRAHLPVRSLTEEVGTTQVERHNRVVIFWCHVGDGLASVHRRTVDQNIEPAQHVRGVLDQLGIGVCCAQISAKGKGLTADRFDLATCFCHLFRRAPMDADCGTRLGQCHGQGSANATRRASDQCSFAFKRKEALKKSCHTAGITPSYWCAR